MKKADIKIGCPCRNVIGYTLLKIDQNRTEPESSIAASISSVKVAQSALSKESMAWKPMTLPVLSLSFLSMMAPSDEV